MTALEPKEQRRLNAILAINAARTIDISRYEEEGCFDRFSYFEGLADQHDASDLALFRSANEPGLL